ncbi:alpha/beta hydrolase family protein [Brachybacterium sp. DNPG3]
MTRALRRSSPHPTTRTGLHRLRPRSEGGRWAEAAFVGAVGAGAAFTLSAGLLTVGARVMARLPLVPQLGARMKPHLPVRAVHPDRVHLEATAESERAGYLALRQSGGAVHVRLGPVDGRPTPTTISRPLLATDTAEPLQPDRSSIDGFFWPGTPWTAHGLPTEEVEVESPVGHMPAWIVRPDEAAGSQPGLADTWAILVHGHGSTRGEALRVIPLLHRLGLTSMAITYRNDSGAPASADRMHHLGSEEWEDAEAAIDHAIAAGARRILLVGWSMGGGIVLRVSVRSKHRDRIAALVLDSPAIDWQDILIYHATSLKAPAPMRRMALWMMTSPAGARMVRLHEPLALDEMRPEYYEKHLIHRTLLFHALDDSTVPPAPSRLLASLRPDLIRFEPFEGASHTREWNIDPVRWERTLAEFLVEALGIDLDPATLPLPIRDPAAAPEPQAIGQRI